MNILRLYIGVVFEQFHYFSSLPRSFASYFITLISKVKCPSHLSEFRLISLVGSFYKPVDKVLAIRLRMVMDKLISPNQLTFIKEKMLVDGMVLSIR